jgi:uncharacterized OB-fold protein
MEYKLTFALFREGLKVNKLFGLKCKDCGVVTCPPRKVCAECGSENLDIIEMKGNGEIKSFTVCYATPAGFQGPYVVAVADMKEGGRLMGNVIDVDPLKTGMELIGKKVKVGFKEIPGDFMTGGDTRWAFQFKLVN